jgi:hypothetical protein
MTIKQVISRVNTPERVVLNSNDDTNSNPFNNGFSAFTLQLPTPILTPHSLQMNRCSFPAATLQIPDYSLCFYYWRLPAATTAPELQYLKCVRLYPSNFLPYTGFTAFSRNRTFSGPSDLVTALNVAAAAGGDNTAFNPLWVSADITFAYNTTTNQITFTGNNSGIYYAPAGYNDPVVATVIAGTSASNIVIPTTNGAGAVNYLQPQVAQSTLNLRVGYALSGTAPGAQSFGAGNPLYADATNTTYANGTAVPADSYPNLNYTNQVSFYTNIAEGSSLTSGNRHNLLASVPIVVPSFGVVSYNQQNDAYLSKISTTINQITIEMRDDYDQPYVLPDSATVVVELTIEYEGTKV